MKQESDYKTRLRRSKRWLVIGTFIWYAAAIALAVVGAFQHLPNVADAAIPALFMGALWTGIILGLSATESIKAKELKDEKQE